MKLILIIKYTALILFHFLFYGNLLSQAPPAKQWDKRFGGSQDDFFYSIIQTSDGGYIMAGFSFSDMDGDKTNENIGSSDIWVVKTDAAGNKQWDKTFGSSSNDRSVRIIQTNDGGYILGILTDGSDNDITDNAEGRYDHLLIKTDAYGNKQWDKIYGAYENEFFTSIKQTSDGGYILAGHSFSDIGGDKTESSRGGFDIWLIRTDAIGNKVWDKTFGGNNDEAQEWVIQTSDGGFLVGAASHSDQSGDRTQPSKGSADYWIVKTDANGNKVWDKTFGGSGDDGLTVLQQTNDGGYILGGYSSSGISGDRSQNNQGSDDYWIVKTDENGNKVWDAAFGGNGEDELIALQQTNDGGYILGGFSRSELSGDRSQNNKGGSDYWIVKTDANGNKLWDAAFGGSGDDDCYDLQQTSDNGFILGGPSNSGISSDRTEDSRGGFDYWIIKLAGNSCNLSVSAGSDENTYFGYLPDQCVSKTAIVSGGTAPYTFSWTLDRPLLSDVITPSGDETMTSTNTATVNVCLLANAELNISITDNNGCVASSSTTIFAKDVRCFTGNSDKQNVKICHGGKTTCLQENAVAAHLAHGDQLGDCANSNKIRRNEEEIQTKELQFSLAPNPSNGLITVKYNSDKTANIHLIIYDMAGRQILSKTEQALNGDNTYYLNISNLSNGNYFFEINDNVINKKKKFMIQK